MSADDPKRRPSDLRAELEAAARRIVDQLRASSVVIDAAEVAARVVEEHQNIPDVRKRLDFMWRHIESYVETILSAGVAQGGRPADVDAAVDTARV